MTNELIKEVSEEDITVVDVHSDAGGSGHQINCPNCNEQIIFAPAQWWRTECGCGEWNLTISATLEANE